VAEEPDYYAGRAGARLGLNVEMTEGLNQVEAACRLGWLARR
jgi:hypothetical protein